MPGYCHDSRARRQDVLDVLVAGSGAAGLTAALTCAAAGLRTVVFEAGDVLGGTTAISGGRVWAPGSHYHPDPGADRRAAAVYLNALLPDQPRMTTAFLETVPAMVRAVEARTRHRFAPCPRYPDYHPGLAGAAAGGRSLDAVPLPLGSLCPAAARLAGLGTHLPVTHAEWELWRYPRRYDWDLIRSRQAAGIVTGGAALTAALVDGVLARGAEIVTGRRLTSLTPRPGGGYNATLTADDGAETAIRARVVILATGGYDQDPDLRARYLPPAIQASAAAPGNRGDALAIAGRLGAQVANLGAAWMMPLLPVPGGAYHALIRERGLPRLIIVDSAGRRFADEAAPYHEFCKELVARQRLLAAPLRAHLIVDEGYRARYGLPAAADGDPVPGWVTRHETLASLAAACGIDAAGLRDQVARWNAACAAGADGEYGKGGNSYDRYYGDPSAAAGNPCLGPLDQPPYYALPVVAGSIGSKGGPVTDEDARVIGAGGDPVRGLYAVGNATAFWAGDEYPGPGATLGAGMTFGYRAARSAIRRFSITIPNPLTEQSPEVRKQ